MSELNRQAVFVNAVIHNGKGQVLLMRRSQSDSYLPGYLELPGGKVAEGLNLEDSLIRKLSEELSLKRVIPMYYASFASKNRQGRYLRIVFELSYDETKSVELAPSHSDYQWVDLLSDMDDVVLPDARIILDQYLGQSRSYSIEEKNTTFTIHSDGGSRGNPGPSASGYVIYNSFNEIVESGGSYIGITSNNQAEYRGLLLALEAVTKFAGSSDTILCNIDSLMVVNQMNGLYKIKNRDLWPLNQQIRELTQRFKQVRFNHIPRELNVVADSKVNEILDAHVPVN